MSPGSSTAPIAPGPPGSRPTSSLSGSAQATAQADEVLVLGRRLFWDPRGPVEFYPQYEKTLGDPMRVSWSADIEDPDEPARLVNRLEGTALGCAWLLDRWNELGDLLADGLKWQAPDRFKATRLLGKQPVDPIDDLQVRWIHLCTSAMDPECRHEFGDIATELDSAEKKRFIERLAGRDAWREKPKDAETAKAALLELVSEQEERLETLLAAHLERESAADPDALGFQDTQEGERLRRYQMACNRTLLRILETLRKRHREADQAKEGGKRARKSSGSASGVESPTEADLLRETFGPVIAQDQEPLVQPAEAVPTDGLVGQRVSRPRPQPDRRSPDSGRRDERSHRPSYRARITRPQPDRRSPDPRERDERSHLPSSCSGHRARPKTCRSRNSNGPPDDAPRTLHVLPAIVVAILALLFGDGLSAAFGTPAPGIGPKPSPRNHFVERPRILAEISTIPWDNRPRPLSSD